MSGETGHPGLHVPPPVEGEEHQDRGAWPDKPREEEEAVMETIDKLEHATLRPALPLVNIHLVIMVAWQLLAASHNSLP